MSFLNHYSALIVAGLILLVGIASVRRRGGRLRQWLALGGVMAAGAAAWWVWRPVAQPALPAAGLPVLLEIQSPFCFGCVAAKPGVDRLERELRGRLAVRRVDIQSAEGRRLARELGVALAPTFILFDGAGQEQWRATGLVDAARVRATLAERPGDWQP